MTPPKVDKVDIRPLETLYLENLLGLEPQQAAQQFTGSDLVLDTKSGELKRLLAGGQVETRSLEEEAAWVQLIRNGDSNGDKSLDLAEARNLLTANLAAEQAGAIEPEKFLASIQELMKNRYGPIANNLKNYQSRSLFGPTVDAIKLYSRGIHADEVHMANRTFALNGVGKTATNAVMFLPSLAYNIFGDAPVLVGDAVAESAAQKKSDAREGAIQKLEAAIAKGVKENEKWALEGNIEQALAQLDSSTRDVLNDELCATRLHKILTLKDEKERYSQLLAFAQGERPGFLGYGGGNSKISGGWFESWWNLSGRRNNIFFAQTIFRFLAVKAATKDANFDDNLDKQSRTTMDDMRGNGGGFGNMAAVGLTNVFCIGGALCEPTEYRDWSDLAAMDGLGRAGNGVLMVWGANRVFNIFGNANRLRQVSSTGEVISVWRKNASIFSKTAKDAPRWKPFGGAAWAERTAALQKEAEMIGVTATTQGRFGQLIDKVTSPLSRAKKAAGAWMFKGLPALSASQTAKLKATGSLAGKGLGKLVKGVLILGIVQYNDSKMSPAFNPFEKGFKDMDREADLNPYPDLTKPDPVLYPSLKK